MERDIFDFYSEYCLRNSTIDAGLYKKLDVKQGLRDENGVGVRTGLTKISTVEGAEIVNGERVPCEGRLEYRGINISKLVDGFLRDDRRGFEEATYLLLFGRLPNVQELNRFRYLLGEMRTLPNKFTRDVIMKAPSKDIMTMFSKCVLTLSSYDDETDDISIPNVLRQCMGLIATFPMIAAYAYHAYNHFEMGGSFYIHYPQPELSTAENLLLMLRPDKKYSALEAKVLDLALILHMEHGGGNNSTFTTHVVSSSGTDTYSTIAAALGSLKGPKHGGANIKVVQMVEDLKKNVNNTQDPEQVRDYLRKLINKEAFDKQGLIYGVGHAIYSLSDPRAKVLKSVVEDLAVEKGREDDYRLYKMIEEMAPEVIYEKHQVYKGVCVNVDFYSGFIYNMLDIPLELYTPLFAIARIVGWSAHRIEELINVHKIIRPAYVSVAENNDYLDLNDRK